MKRYLINRAIRECLGLSGQYFASKVEVTKQAISRYERGGSVIRPLERVYEMELDLAIDNCDVPEIKECCEKLKLRRTEEA